MCLWTWVGLEDRPNEDKVMGSVSVRVLTHLCSLATDCTPTPSRRCLESRKSREKRRWPCASPSPMTRDIAQRTSISESPNVSVGKNLRALFFFLRIWYAVILSSSYPVSSWIPPVTEAHCFPVPPIQYWNSSDKFFLMEFRTVIL